MSKISVLFFDVGGVCLTNGWDEESRTRAAEYFHLDRDEMERRHHLSFEPLERGEISLDEYLARLIFYQSRTFAKDVFVRFMEGESKPHKTTLDSLKRIKKTGN